jgi:hypothetical protein
MRSRVLSAALLILMGAAASAQNIQIQKLDPPPGSRDMATTMIQSFRSACANQDVATLTICSQSRRHVDLGGGDLAAQWIEERGDEVLLGPAQLEPGIVTDVPPACGRGRIEGKVKRDQGHIGAVAVLLRPERAGFPTCIDIFAVPVVSPAALALGLDAGRLPCNPVSRPS